VSLQRWGDAFGAGSAAINGGTIEGATFKPLTYTWATKPAAAAGNSGQMIWIEDSNILGSLFISTGTRWVPVNGHLLLAAQNAGVTKTDANTTEAVLFSTTVPGGLLGPNGALRITCIWSHTATTTGKTMKVTLGGSAVFNRTQTGATLIYLTQQLNVWNQNNEAVQIMTPNDVSFASYTQDDNSPSNDGMTVNTASDQLLELRGSWAAAGSGSNVLTLKAVTVEAFVA
jgi:hypothetical protein